jgi:hypothetical protein
MTAVGNFSPLPSVAHPTAPSIILSPADWQEVKRHCTSSSYVQLCVRGSTNNAWSLYGLLSIGFVDT